MSDFWKSIFGPGAEAAGKALQRGSADGEGQRRLNEAEIAGAPASRLRLWRSFLGWVLSMAFVWEALLRPIIATWWPQTALPPSFIKETTTLLLGLIGLGV